MPVGPLIKANSTFEVMILVMKLRAMETSKYFIYEKTRRAINGEKNSGKGKKK
jgi:hypothetical protein